MNTFINTNPTTLILLILLGWSGFLTWQFLRIWKKNKMLFKGTKGKDLEEVIKKELKDIKKLDQDYKDLLKISEKIHQIAARGIQKVGIVRFNPFQDTGGNQSFAIALLDYYNNGLVISSLHSREGTRVYTKPIKKGQSEYSLSEEEKEAINKAISSESK